MFENLRRAFREAVDNFYEELNRDQVPETADRLLRAMREEMVQVRAQEKRTREQLHQARGAWESETRNVETCLRREEMAVRIGDEETAQVARDYARKHEERRMVLEQKVDALEKELALVEAEFSEMSRQYKSAETRRSSLSASAGRTGARQSLNEADELFQRLDRMAEDIEDRAARAEAEDLLSREFDLRDVGGVEIPPARDLDTRLEELKRRMEQRDG